MKTHAPVHPGEVLHEDFLIPLGLSEYRVAKDIGVPPRRINEIVKGSPAETPQHRIHHMDRDDLDLVSGGMKPGQLWVIAGHTFRGKSVLMLQIAAVYLKTRECRAIVHDADCLLFITEEDLKIGKLPNGRRDDLLPLFLNGAMQRFTADPKP